MTIGQLHVSAAFRSEPSGCDRCRAGGRPASGARATISKSAKRCVRERAAAFEAQTRGHTGLKSPSTTVGTSPWSNHIPSASPSTNSISMACRRYFRAPRRTCATGGKCQQPATYPSAVREQSTLPPAVGNVHRTSPKTMTSGSLPQAVRWLERRCATPLTMRS